MYKFTKNVQKYLLIEYQSEINHIPIILMDTFDNHLVEMYVTSPRIGLFVDVKIKCICTIDDRPVSPISEHPLSVVPICHKIRSKKLCEEEQFVNLSSKPRLNEIFHQQLYFSR